MSIKTIPTTFHSPKMAAERDPRDGGRRRVEGLEDLPEEATAKATAYREFLLRGVPLRVGEMGKLGGFSLGLEPLKRRLDRVFVLDGAALAYFSDHAAATASASGHGPPPRGVYSLDGAVISRNVDVGSGEIRLVWERPRGPMRPELLFEPGGAPERPPTPPPTPKPIGPVLRAWEADMHGVIHVLRSIPPRRNHADGPAAALRLSRPGEHGAHDTA
jgi:hypothetical protein